MRPWKLNLLFGLLVTATTASPVAAQTNAVATPPPATKKKRPVKPADLPGSLPVLEAPRGWGDTFLPKSKAPARAVLSVPLAGLNNDERVAVCCLQGLSAREQPRLWLIRGQEDLFWMDWHRQRGHVERFETVTNWPALFRQFRDVVKGAVVPDDQLFRGDLLALNVASCDDLMVASPRLAERLGLPVQLDLRGRFKTYAEGLEWLWANYKTELNPHLCDFRYPGLLVHGTFDYSYQWRALMFWVAGPKEETKPGADRLAEHRLMAGILAQMPVNGVCVGFPAMNEGEGMGEPAGVELLSRYGKSLVCNNHGGNYSILSGVRLERLDPPQPPPPPVLERDMLYVALAMSDGDNQILWPGYFRRHFDHPAFGRFPLAFGMGPAMRELQPGLAQWYYEHAKPTTEFFADMGRYSGRSGITNLTYTLPDAMPVFRSVTSWRYGKDGFLREIREQVGAQRPAFVNGFVHCWTFDLDDLVRFYEQRDADMVFVTPAQLAALYRATSVP